MSEMNQESEFEVPTLEEDVEQLQESLNLGLLRLDSSKSDHSNRHQCSNCGCNAAAAASNPMKRPSPEPSFGPKSKKPSLESRHGCLSGYSKLPLPQLHRTVSDPTTPPKANLFENPKGVEETPLSKGSVSCTALPPKPPVLRRSISDVSSSPVKSYSRSSSSNEMGLDLAKDESPTAKRLRRLKERMKEMSQWWDEAMREDEDVCTTAEAIKDDGGDLDCEEAVKVEKVGDCLDIHFKCPCGKGYQILLSGQSCYYKLI